MARILVATADAALRADLAKAYRLTGHVVVEVPDADACLAEIEKRAPGALVLDPRLPNLEVSSLLRLVRRAPPPNAASRQAPSSRPTLRCSRENSPRPR